ncbi:hypothetical protein [Xenorhabdus ehlersii]|uniref:Iron-regulated protein frpC n=1 Tax=Xenorhabdus ehlersii TaxID=290111 RepID=A0A2D0IMA1_9GAMM|nr:hypothetical protein [Xenorhabdus ehlersii]PHM22954.1 Iron-regulated protein frpC [Xenorhabdus ehlersii]RKE92623.1 hypothetical protein BDE27_0275 [Xenorhabdus ehlersii]
MENILKIPNEHGAYTFQHEVTVHVAKPGTKIKNSNGSYDTSKTGHVWLSIEMPGSTRTFKTDAGWSTGDSMKVGGYDNVNLNDSEMYDKSTVKSVTINMAYSNVEKLAEFVNKAPLGLIKGFSSNYNLLTNNCIHFVRFALNYVDSNAGNKVLPYFTPNQNYGSLESMINNNINLPSPLVIDLNNDGVKTIAEGSVFFDLDNNNSKESVGWIDKNDGFIVYDKNNDGKIDSGAFLFGNHTEINGLSNFKNGFHALSQLDSNNDLIISKDDNDWNNLKVWQDKNTNGIVDNDELNTLSDIGIKEIDLNYKGKPFIDDNKNLHKDISQVTWDYGDKTDIVDVWFLTHPKVTKENSNPVIQQEIHKIVNSMVEFNGEISSFSENQILSRQNTMSEILTIPN